MTKKLIFTSFNFLLILWLLGLFWKNNVASVLNPWICQFVSLQSLHCLTVKAVEASINVSNVSYKSCTLLWYAKNEKYLHKIDVPKIGILLTKST